MKGWALVDSIDALDGPRLFAKIEPFGTGDGAAQSCIIGNDHSHAQDVIPALPCGQAKLRIDLRNESSTTAWTSIRGSRRMRLSASLATRLYSPTVGGRAERLAKRSQHESRYPS